MLELSRVSKKYSTNRFGKKKQFAIDDISLSIIPGKTLGLVGESGSGKTTIGLLASGLIQPTKGEIFIDGASIKSLIKNDPIKFRKLVQIIFQSSESALDPRMTTLELIKEPLLVNHIESSDDSIYNLMKKVGLGMELCQRYPHELSGGQRQRICVARATALNPTYLIADEPAASLDYSVQAQILELIKIIQTENNVGLLLISHHLKIVKIIADEIAVMFQGKIIEKGIKEKIFQNPLHPYTRDLIASLPGIHRRGASTFSPLVSKKDYLIKKGCPYFSRCKNRTEICREKEPELSRVEEEHSVSCHLIFHLACKF